MERDRQWRYLIAFSDGGAGPRFYLRPLADGDEITDGADRYRISDVVQPARAGIGGGRARADLLT